MLANCNKCKNNFNLDKLSQQFKVIDGMELQETYFECPHCGAHYNVRIDNSSTFAKKEQIQKKMKELGTIKDNKQYETKQKEVSKRIRKLKKEVKILKQKYLKYFMEE